LTFKVVRLEELVQKLKTAGYRIVGENYSNAEWKEAFISPTRAHGTIVQLAESIRSQWTPGMSGRAVGRLLGKPNGGSWNGTINKIIEYLSATTATATTDSPDLPLNGRVE
jgi:hypothetical protein